MEKGILKYFNTVYKKYNNLYKLKVNTCLRLAKLKKQPFQIFDEMVDLLINYLMSTIFNLEESKLWHFQH